MNNDNISLEGIVFLLIFISFNSIIFIMFVKDIREKKLSQRNFFQLACIMFSLIFLGISASIASKNAITPFPSDKLILPFLCFALSITTGIISLLYRKV